jgi:hypothetical protein
MNRRCRRAYIVAQAALGVTPALASQRLSPPLFSARETGAARAWSTLLFPVPFRQPGRRCMLNGRTSS